MKKLNFSLIIKITGIVFIAFVIVLGNEMRLGIDRYIKNTLETDAEATKVNLDKFSKAYVETISLKKVDLKSDNFQKIYKDALGGDTTKIKCLLDNKGKIMSMSREGRSDSSLCIVLNGYQGVSQWPVYFNLSSLGEESIDNLEKTLRNHIDDVNNVSISLRANKLQLDNINQFNDIEIKELKINDEIIAENDLKGEFETIEGVLNSYESNNLEAYFYRVTQESLKSSVTDSQEDTDAAFTVSSSSVLVDYQNMIKGLKMNIASDFQGFIKNGSPLNSTNYADYYLLKPYEYEDKYYSTVLLRLIDWNKISEQGTGVDLNNVNELEAMTAGYVLVVQEYDDLTNRAFQQFMLDNSSTYFLAFILIGFICISIAYTIIVPIRRIERTAKHIARKEFDYPIDMTRHDELGDLSRSIDTMSKELEKTINNLYQEVDRVQRLEDLRKEFVSNFTHEIKTPLGIINGFSELVELEKDEKKRNEYILIIQNETRRINELVLAMLDLSKLESESISLSLEDIDLLDIVDETIDSMKYLFEKKKIQLQTTLDSAPLLADRFRMEMVVTNFISNALRYTDEGKAITIELNEHRFSIENEGTHIPEEEFEKIWLTFHKVDKSRNEEGTGLGLAICKTVLERHHLQYGVQNTDSGVKFYFEF